MRPFNHSFLSIKTFGYVHKTAAICDQLVLRVDASPRGGGQNKKLQQLDPLSASEREPQYSCYMAEPFSRF
jgi:hypothetical protein